MKFCIISLSLHTINDGNCYAYGPYVREMNLWLDDKDELICYAANREGLKDVLDKNRDPIEQKASYGKNMKLISNRHLEIIHNFYSCAV